MIHVVTKIERVAPDLVRAFTGLSSALVHEASGKSGAMDPAIKPLARGPKVCGPACTVAAPIGDNLMIHRAIYVAAPGDVLVVDNGGASSGPWGEIMTIAAMQQFVGP
jgi:4-hydroxy-4-methyl-2-oxoglutarate aldolase